MLAPLSALGNKKIPWDWTATHQHAFDTTKHVIACKVLLAQPDFSKPHELCTDTSDFQLGAIVVQGEKPIAYCGRKLNSAQLNYTTAERELLAIVETLKEFCTMLIGHKIIMHTDHKNLAYRVFNAQRVMRW